MRYRIHGTEHAGATVIVEADSPEEALEAARNGDYNDITIDNSLGFEPDETTEPEEA